MIRLNIDGIGTGNPELITNQSRQDIEESNIAMIGMGELFDTVIYDGNGNIEKMRGKFNELIKDAWEVLDEHLE